SRRLSAMCCGIAAKPTDRPLPTADCSLPTAHLSLGSRRRLRSGFIPTVLQLFVCCQITHQHVIKITALTAGKDPNLNLAALENLQLIIHPNICFPLICGRKTCAFNKLRYELIDV